jgi:hypothetical protein
VKIVEGTETQWFLDFLSRKERPQYAIKVRLSEQAEAMKQEAIKDSTADLIAAKKLDPDIAKQRATEANQHWNPAFLEWCAEAYLDTDYSLLTSEMFEAALKEYAISQLRTPNAP